MEEVKNADTSKSPRDDVREDGARRFGIHGLEPGEDIVQLGQAVDDDENVGDFELRRVPKYHPSCEILADGSRARMVEKHTTNTDVAESIIGHKVN